MSLDVCAIGLGAIGALYAFALERSSRVRVTAVCRSNYDVVQEHGIDFVSDRLGTHAAWKPYRVVRTVEEAADRDYVFVVCAFKCLPDVITTPALLTPILARLATASQPTAFVLLQNGVGIEDDLLAALAETKPGADNVVISGCAWVDATAVDGGRKVTQFGNERLVLGYHHPAATLKTAASFSDARAHEVLDGFCGLLRAGGANVEAAEDVDIARWRKVLWNASFSTLCTLARVPVCAVLANDSSCAAVASIMREVLSVAHAALPPTQGLKEVLSDSVVNNIIEHENHESTFRPSMLVDLDAGRPMEVEAIVGGVLRRARAHGVQTPQLDLIYAALNVMQRELIKRRGSAGL
ncbi:hypothetical protein OBBRIDRAFT_562509 [Obba rivulosa]|uniref:2-dehydropantoate 2-reductase n=1 Tax=Obba rivulosa TaxID=1052685 RepID=A0A8E2B3U6_9APHY|nr:hypothetical protein OBBRIDRAFT_562509 [Obba rivulosa]